MLTYILRRILLMVPTLLGITIVVFTIMAMAPGGLTATLLEGAHEMRPEERAALEAYLNQRYGLDQPAPIQYLRWLNNILPFGLVDTTGDGNLDSFHLFKGSDLGMSFRTNRPVADLLAERIPVTVMLNLLSVPIIYITAIAIGMRAARKRGQLFDVTAGIVTLGLWSVPTMLTGVLMIGFLANSQYWYLFPTGGLTSLGAEQMAFLPTFSSTHDALVAFGMPVLGVALFAGVGWLVWRGLGAILFSLLGLCVGFWAASELVMGPIEKGYLLDLLHHLVLPVVCLSYGGLAFLSKLTRTAVLENLLADYARTARAKGVSEDGVVWRHVFRNSLLPLITVAAALLPGLLGGSVIVEKIFSIDGMGKLAIDAIHAREREVVLSITVISGTLVLIGYLLADICYAIADPRVSYD